MFQTEPSSPGSVWARNVHEWTGVVLDTATASERIPSEQLRERAFFKPNQARDLEGARLHGDM